MAQILVRNLESEVVERLRRRAKSRGRSLEAEVRAILENSAKVEAGTAREMLAEYRSRFEGRRFSDSADLIAEDRGR